MANELVTRKTCTRCAVEKPLEDFSRARKSRDGRNWVCKLCRKQQSAVWYQAGRDTIREQRRRYYEANKEAALARSKRRQREKPNEIAAQHRRWLLEREYGLTAADYEAMLDAQDGVCAVCRRPEVGNRRLPVDHDHETGRVRGLLCTPCNVTLGAVGDDPARLRALALYLESAAVVRAS